MERAAAQSSLLECSVPHIPPTHAQVGLAHTRASYLLPRITLSDTLINPYSSFPALHAINTSPIFEAPLYQIHLRVLLFLHCTLPTHWFPHLSLHCSLPLHLPHFPPVFAIPTWHNSTASRGDKQPHCQAASPVRSTAILPSLPTPIPLRSLPGCNLAGALPTEMAALRNLRVL